MLTNGHLEINLIWTARLIYLCMILSDSTMPNTSINYHMQDQGHSKGLNAISAFCRLLELFLMKPGVLVCAITSRSIWLADCMVMVSRLKTSNCEVVDCSLSFELLNLFTPSLVISAPGNTQLLRTDLNFDAQIRDPCVILMHTYFQSDWDSRWSFSISMKPD